MLSLWFLLLAIVWEHYSLKILILKFEFSFFSWSNCVYFILKVQTAADDLRDCSTGRTSKLQQEMSNMQNCTSSAQEEWTSYVGEMEKHYIEDTTAVETGQDKMDDGLKFW